jgi:hypothetical protein
VDPEHLRAFAQRDRTEVDRLKIEHWARVYREEGEQATLDAGHALYEHARRVRPDFPTERDRAEDLAHHIHLKGLLDRASRALAVR